MNNLSEREELFKKEVEKTEFDQKTKDKFFDYWSEPNKSGTKMKWEMEKTFDLNRRIKRFYQNIKDWDHGNSRKTISQQKRDAAANFIEKARSEFAATIRKANN